MKIKKFRDKWGISSEMAVVGTTCILRSWKGINDFLGAAKNLEDDERIQWLVVGDGPCSDSYRKECKRLGLENRVIFTGHLENPYPAIAAMDLFLLLSTGNEGVSQASLQAGYLSKPMVTTRTGGLPEVCVNGKNGFNVDNNSPNQVADAVKAIVEDKERRDSFGKESQKLVKSRFTYSTMLDQMEETYRLISIK